MQTVLGRKPTGFQILGAHVASNASLDLESSYFDAVDFVVSLDDSSRVVLGIRTVGYVEHLAASEGEVSWQGPYRPLPITLDFSTVRFWDFNRTLWVGPGSRPCLVYSNAQGISRLGIETLLAPPRQCSLLLGPDGAGLPAPEELGLRVPTDGRIFPLRAP